MTKKAAWMKQVPNDVVVGWFKPGIDRWDQRVVAVVADNPTHFQSAATTGP